MLRIFLFTVLLVNLMVAKEVPLSLPSNIDAETNALVFYPSSKWQELGYTSYYKHMNDVLIDDSGNVNIIIDEHYRPRKHIWSYLRYNKLGNKFVQKEIYSGTYVTALPEMLYSRMLINPDMTVLVFYPNSEFYTCWVKIDREGNIVERSEPRWWRGDAGSPVYSAGQDSFHIIASPISHWKTLIKRHDSLIGDYYEMVEPVLTPSYFYSNNFKLQGKRIGLRGRYSVLGVEGAISLPGNRLLCYSSCWTYFIDSEGNCYDGEKFEWEDLEKICFAKVEIDSILERIAKEVHVPILDFFETAVFGWGRGFGLFPDSTVGLGICYKKTLYFVKYDLNGKIIQSGKGVGKIVKIMDLDQDKILPFITQIQRDTCNIFLYWGFDNMGNVFLQKYY
jgi:hypothetical protein